MQKNSKVYWYLLKNFINNKKIPIIPPLFYENCFITDLKEKAELFNFFFCKQCSLLPNNGSPPADANYITDKRLSAAAFSPENIEKMTVCYYHVTQVFHSESTLYSSLNVKELLAQKRRDIWSLSDCNGI